MLMGPLRTRAGAGEGLSRWRDFWRRGACGRLRRPARCPLFGAGLPPPPQSPTDRSPARPTRAPPPGDLRSESVARSETGHNGVGDRLQRRSQVPPGRRDLLYFKKCAGAVENEAVGVQHVAAEEDPGFALAGDHLDGLRREIVDGDETT